MIENNALNTIYNMDCIEGMKRLIKKYGEQCVDVTLTDIPYGGVSKKGAERAKYGGQLRKFDKGEADIETFDLDEFLELTAKITKGSVYIFCGASQLSQIYDFFESKNKEFMVRLCSWKKTNPTPANGQHMWLSSMEICIFAKRRKTKFNQHCKSAVWEFPVGRSKIHPTEKPLDLFKYLIESSSDEGDVIFDPCMGSGTTAVASKLLKREYIGFELHKPYFNDANKRLSELHNE